MVRLLVINELGRMWKEALIWGTVPEIAQSDWGKKQKATVRVAILRVEIRTRKFRVYRNVWLNMRRYDEYLMDC
jgi:hypothetical protein